VVAAERDLQPPRTRDLAVLVTWLAPHTEWLADHVAADEHAGDVRRAWSGLRRSTGVGMPRRRPLPQPARCPMCEASGHLWLLPVTHRPETRADGVPVHPQPVVVECLREPDDLGEKGCGHVIREQDMPRWVTWLEQLDRDARRERLAEDRRHRAEVEAQERRARRQARGAA